MTNKAYKEIFIVLRYRENERNVKEGKGKKCLKSLSLSSISFAGLNLIKSEKSNGG